MSFAQALHELCHGSTREFAIIYTDDSGKLDYQVSPSLEHHVADIFPEDLRALFAEIVEEEHKIHHVETSPCYHRRTLRRPAMARNPYRQNDTVSVHYGQSARMPKRRPPKIDMSRTRRRKIMPRTITPSSLPFHVTSSDEESNASETDAFEGAKTTSIPIFLSDETTLNWFYYTRFIQMQQIACKRLSKAWIKVVQPKKQSRYPYNGGELTKPDWWPPFECRHKEPDHISKSERLILLLHILRNLYNQKVGEGDIMTVSLLQQSTNQSFGNQSRFEKSLKYLHEIYAVRLQEERYIRGEIDGKQSITVAMPDHGPSERWMKVNPRIASAEGVKQNRTAAHQPRIIAEGSLARQQQSPEELRLSMHQSDASQPKQTLLPILYSSGSQGCAASTTAQASFFSTEVQCSPCPDFGVHEPLQSPPWPEDTYAGHNSAAALQVPEPMQTLTAWYPTTITTAQPQERAYASHLYMPSLPSGQHIGSFVLNQQIQSTTAMPYLAEPRYSPAQTDFGTYGSGDFSESLHNLPGYDSTTTNTQSCY